MGTNSTTVSPLVLSVQHLDRNDKAAIRCLTLLRKGVMESIWRVSEVDAGAHAVITPPSSDDAVKCGTLAARMDGDAQVYELDWPLRDHAVLEGLNWAARQLRQIRGTDNGGGKGWFSTLFGQRRRPVKRVGIASSPSAQAADYLARLGIRGKRPTLTGVVVGSPGAGKTTAIVTVSDRPVGVTDVTATDTVSGLKQRTTIALDYGEHDLPDRTRLRLFGMPGQLRFAHMIEQTLCTADAVLMLVDTTSNDPLADVKLYASVLRDSGLMQRPIVLGMTHTDLKAPPRHFQREVNQVLGLGTVSIDVDPRSRSSVVRALSLLAAKSRDGRLMVA